MKLELNKTVKDNIAGYTFISPVMLGIGMFNFIPIILSIYFSFTNYDNINVPEFVGASNFINMFKDPVFLNSIVRTFEYAIITVPIGLALSFSFALLLNSDVKGVGVYRTLLYLPCIVPGVASAMIWQELLAPVANGRFNQILLAIGIIDEPFPFLTHPDTVLFSMILMSLYGLGGGVLFWISGFKGVPTALYEVAALEGAKWYHRLFKITIPMVSPIIFYNLVSSIIGSLQAFGTSMLMTGGGPVGKTNYLGFNIYTEGLQNMKMGYACAQSWFLFAVILVLTLILFKTGGWVYYGEEQ